jgi:hypothetical protein
MSTHAEEAMPVTLCCEYSGNPLGIDTTRPGLSWRIESDRRGQRQTAYRILAASSPEVVVVQPDALRPADPGQIRLEGLVGYRVDGNRKARLAGHVALSEHRLLEGFRERPGRQSYTGEHAGKWLDAAATACAYDPADQVLQHKLDRIAAGLIDCQMPDGYLGTYLQAERWTSWDVWVHKYDLIGLLAYYRATGDRRALAACRRAADLLVATFHDGGREILKSDDQLGLASTSVLEPICRLYEQTGDPRYLQFARYIIRKADEGPRVLTAIEQFKTVQRVGNKKAYEMMSVYLGLIEYWRATGERRGLEAAILAWDSIRRENVHLTGGIDAHEVFCPPHVLHTTGAVTETCVQAQWLMLNLQLLRITGEARYADEIHRHVYNHLLAAQRPDGSEWCYFTTMEGEKSYDGVMTCCASNGARAIALLPTLAVMTGPRRLTVNLYETSTFRGEVEGVPVTVRQTTDYPWDGRVRLVVTPQRPVEFELQLLVPFFASKASLRIGRGSQWEEPGARLAPGTYAGISRLWSGETTIELAFDMPAVAHERAGRFAISRGPLVLAYDEAINHGLRGTGVVPDASRLGESAWRPAAAELHGSPGGRVLAVPGKQLPLAAGSGSPLLLYRPFCEAGSAGGVMSVYLPRAENVVRPSKETAPRPPRIPGAVARTSRDGTIRGAFLSGDERSTCLTNNGQNRDTDWFAAIFAKPIRIDRVIFVHGRFLPGGGWWVAKDGQSAALRKPAVEVLKTRDGPWEQVAVLADYPESTAADPGGARPHAMFVVPIKPMEVVGVRVAGVPSSGSDPTQNMASCALLDVHCVSGGCP